MGLRQRKAICKQKLPNRGIVGILKGSPCAGIPVINTMKISARMLILRNNYKKVI